MTSDELLADEAYKRFPDKIEPFEGHPLGKIVQDNGNLRYAFIVGAQYCLANGANQEAVPWPRDGSCIRCSAVPRTSSGLCNTCLDEDAEKLENSTSPAAGWDEAIEAAARIVRDFTGAGNNTLYERTIAIVQAIEALRRAAPAPEGVAPTHIDSGGRAVIEGGDVVIRFPLDAMQSAIDGAWSLNVFDTRYKITNIDEFSKEFVYALNREDEQGTTNIHRLADKAFIDCIESGAFGIEEHEQQEI